MSDSFSVKSFIDTEQLAIDVNVDVTDLDNAMIRHPALYVHYATQTVKAKRQYDQFCNMMEILEAKLDRKYRDELTDGGTKKTTEAAIRNAVVADKMYLSMQKKVLEAQEVLKLCEVAEKAFVQRKDLILEIARDRRKEREGQLRIMEQKALRDSVKGMLSSS